MAFVFFPSLLLAQELGYYDDPCRQAQLDAIRYENPYLWLASSCGANCLVWPVGGPAVVAAAYFTEPTPPYWELEKVPKEERGEYTQCYSRRARRIRVKGAALGCLLSNAAVAALLFLPILFQ